MGPRYWLVTKASTNIVEEDNLKICTEEQRERETIFLALPESEYIQVKVLKTSHEIWKTLEAKYEGDTHAKRVRLKNLHCAFQDAKMMEDESIRNYVGRISEIVAGI